MNWSDRFLELVRQVPTIDLVKATGLSDAYIRRVKAHTRIPLREHWPAFEKAILERNGSVK